MVRKVGLTPAGLISPAIFEAGEKVGIDLVEIPTGQRHRLATRKVDDEPPRRAELETQHWRFDPSALTWGNEALSRGALASTEMLILDELGPLELLENRGLTAGIDLVDKRKYQLAVVVIRPALLSTAQLRWPWAKALQLQSSAATL